MTEELLYIILWGFTLAPFITLSLILIYKLMGYILYIRWTPKHKREYTLNEWFTL